jgi:hypothetical protein
MEQIHRINMLETLSWLLLAVSRGSSDKINSFYMMCDKTKLEIMNYIWQLHGIIPVPDNVLNWNCLLARA